MKKRDPSLTIRALITAAEALFTQKGYYPVTIKELGEKAGCSPALISYYFGGKKDLYRAVVDRQLSIIDDLKQETKETPLDSLQKIHYFLKALLRTSLIRQAISIFATRNSSCPRAFLMIRFGSGSFHGELFEIPFPKGCRRRSPEPISR